MRLESGVVRLTFQSMSANEIQAKLASREMPIWCKTTEDSLQLVMRSIDPADDNEIVLAFESLFSNLS